VSPGCAWHAHGSSVLSIGVVEGGRFADTKKDHGPRVWRAPMILEEYASTRSGQ